MFPRYTLVINVITFVAVGIRIEILKIKFFSTVTRIEVSQSCANFVSKLRRSSGSAKYHSLSAEFAADFLVQPLGLNVHAGHILCLRRSCQGSAYLEPRTSVCDGRCRALIHDPSREGSSGLILSLWYLA